MKRICGSYMSLQEKTIFGEPEDLNGNMGPLIKSPMSENRDQEEQGLAVPIASPNHDEPNAFPEAAETDGGNCVQNNQDTVSASNSGEMDITALNPDLSAPSNEIVQLAAPNLQAALADQDPLAIDQGNSDQEKQDTGSASIGITALNYVQSDATIAIDDSISAADSSDKPAAIDGNKGAQGQIDNYILEFDPIPAAVEYAISSADCDPLAGTPSGLVMPLILKTELEEMSSNEPSSDLSEPEPQTTVNEELSLDTSEENGSGENEPGSVQNMNRCLNRQLSKSLIPKDAWMVINGVKGVVISRATSKRDSEGKFKAHITVNEKQYYGEGPSTISAKNKACEQALIDIIIAKLADQNTSDDQDDLFVMMLASFAMHKLSEEWKLEGFNVPLKRSELPLSWKTMHPSLVLTYMRPNTIFEYLGSTGEQPNELFEMGVKVYGQEFKAKGTSKKNARRFLAAQVCNKLFGTDFSTGDTT
ncbi:uncharacterized protein LOC108047326 isoform X1 [Drosophila rhopaloa]|uniref:DRBM domain-containing protein n=1 Tax=Drosophila rhopaloa TaxID=1041015 RepID=A0ABM5HNH4_DRORH|nr:uncharacterized protein LOC108047326 isoform X1 [Drosophila rhopaloa]